MPPVRLPRAPPATPRHKELRRENVRMPCPGCREFGAASLADGPWARCQRNTRWRRCFRHEPTQTVAGWTASKCGEARGIFVDPEPPLLALCGRRMWAHRRRAICRGGALKSGQAIRMRPGHGGLGDPAASPREDLRTSTLRARRPTMRSAASLALIRGADANASAPSAGGGFLRHCCGVGEPKACGGMG